MVNKVSVVKIEDNFDGCDNFLEIDRRFLDDDDVLECAESQNDKALLFVKVQSRISDGKSMGLEIEQLDVLIAELLKERKRLNTILNKGE